MHLGRNTSHLAGKNTSGLGRKLGQNLGILIIDFFKGKVETLGGHRLIVLSEVNPPLNGLGLRHDKIGKGQGLSKLAMESATIEEGVKLLLLETNFSIFQS